MAQPQLIVKREPSTVVQGTRQQIAEALKQLGEEEELTLLIPGKEIGQNGSVSSTTSKTFEEVFGPLQQGFEASGLTEEEVGEFVDTEIKAYRAERQTKEPSSHG